MAVTITPPPSFNVAVPDFTQKALEGAQLRNLTSEMALRQALAPGQVQQQQQQVQAADIENQMKTMQLQGQQALQKWLSEGDTNEEIDPGTFALNSKIATFVGIPPDDPILQVVRSMAKHGVPAPMLMAEAQGMLQRRTEYNKGTEEQQKIVKDNYDVWKDALAPIFNASREEQSPLVAAALPRLAAATHLSPELDAMVNLLRQNPQMGVPIAYNLVAAQDKALGLSKAAAEAAAATPEGKAKIAGAEAQAKLNVESSPQGLRLAANKAALEANARQSAAQGDPASAGQLLASGQLTLNDLKSRGTTPKFITQAVAAAQKISPNYNPADEVIAESVAKSPAANQFFGSANSLIGKGGTLDQLERLGKSIPQHDFPVLNSIDDWQKLARGKGPLAAYAATALGVADDYGKVMGGGNASDHARDAALQLFSQAASPEQRAQAVAATRDAVQSQRDSRIGNNQFLKRQYGTEVSKGSGSQSQTTPQGRAVRDATGRILGYTTDGRSMTPVGAQ